uniref:Arabidopsis retrotransposon Orf1 C-terminal domain-containing protein n=1 Tax=Brassica oleracea var. oleracea TaxID=109376 RepID=A0A0D3A042_BRAOL
MGNLATKPQVLYPELVRKFMATVNLYHAHEKAKRANDGILTFFIYGIRYRVPLSALRTIYGFENKHQHAIIPEFAGISTFWEHIDTGYFDSAKTLQTDIRHPTLR